MGRRERAPSAARRSSGGAGDDRGSRRLGSRSVRPHRVVRPGIGSAAADRAHRRAGGPVRGRLDHRGGAGPASGRDRLSRARPRAASRPGSRLRRRRHSRLGSRDRAAIDHLRRNAASSVNAPGQRGPRVLSRESRPSALPRTLPAAARRRPNPALFGRRGAPWEPARRAENRLSRATRGPRCSGRGRRLRTITARRRSRGRADARRARVPPRGRGRAAAAIRRR